MSKRKLPEINKKIFPYDLVIAYWEDIVGSCEWSDISDIKKSKTAVCCSFGWLVEQNLRQLLSWQILYLKILDK